jgi:predicted peptidase
MDKVWITSLAIAAALAAAAEVRAAEATDPAAAVFEARVYRDASGGQLAYQLMKPADYDSGKKYPLVVFLHGSGERGTDNAAQLKNGVKEFVGSAEARAKYPCFALVPQCPPDDSWSPPAASMASGCTSAACRWAALERGISSRAIPNTLRRPFPSAVADRSPARHW